MSERDACFLEQRPALLVAVGLLLSPVRLESTVRRGRDEVLSIAADVANVGRRSPAAWWRRHSQVLALPGLEGAPNDLIEPTRRGDPESPLRRTTKSVGDLSTELGGQGLIGQVAGLLEYTYRARRFVPPQSPSEQRA